MALITCPECERSVSEQAKECPQCGYPIQDMKTTDPYEYARDHFKPDSMDDEEKKLSNNGTISFILALVSLFLPIPVIDALIAVGAIILGISGLKAKKRGFAIAGIVIGVIALIGALSLLVSGEYFELWDF